MAYLASRLLLRRVQDRSIPRHSIERRKRGLLRRSWTTTPDILSATAIEEAPHLPLALTLLANAHPFGAMKRFFRIGHGLEPGKEIGEEIARRYIRSHPSLRNAKVSLILLIHFVYNKRGEIFTKIPIPASSTAIVDTVRRTERRLKRCGSDLDFEAFVSCVLSGRHEGITPPHTPPYR